MKRVIVTTSWDDGHILDKRLATLLKKYGIAGTFYIAPHNRELKPSMLLTKKEILNLSKDFEIGSHTMSHHVMPDLTDEECAIEIEDSKKYLEALTGTEITSFCYPRGAYTKQIARQVQQAGYLYARTVKEYDFGATKSWLEAGTSIETHRLPIPRLGPSFMEIARFCGGKPLKTLLNLSWERRAKTMFDMVRQHGGVFHLWGHSWAIENERGWKKVESVLDYIHGHTDVSYLTNAELAQIKGQKS